jgi:hypothetical protein
LIKALLAAPEQKSSQDVKDKEAEGYGKTNGKEKKDAHENNE